MFNYERYNYLTKLYIFTNIDDFLKKPVSVSVPGVRLSVVSNNYVKSLLSLLWTSGKWFPVQL